MQCDREQDSRSGRIDATLDPGRRHGAAVQRFDLAAPKPSARSNDRYRPAFVKPQSASLSFWPQSKGVPNP